MDFHFFPSTGQRFWFSNVQSDDFELESFRVSSSSSSWRIRRASSSLSLWTVNSVIGPWFQVIWKRIIEWSIPKYYVLLCSLSAKFCLFIFRTHFEAFGGSELAKWRKETYSYHLYSLRISWRQAFLIINVCIGQLEWNEQVPGAKLPILMESATFPCHYSCHVIKREIMKLFLRKNLNSWFTVCTGELTMHQLGRSLCSSHIITLVLRPVDKM